MNKSVGYDILYLDGVGNPAGRAHGVSLYAARGLIIEELSKFLRPYDQHWAGLLDVETQEPISAYRTTPEGNIIQVSPAAIPRVIGIRK